MCHLYVTSQENKQAAIKFDSERASAKAKRVTVHIKFVGNFTKRGLVKRNITRLSVFQWTYLRRHWLHQD